MTHLRVALLLAALLLATPTHAADVRPSPNVLNDPTISGTITGTYTLGGTPTITSPTISGTVAGGASYTAPTITSPTISGTVAGGASYTAPTITSPTISGTVAGSASYTSPTLTSPTISGTVAGTPTWASAQTFPGLNLSSGAIIDWNSGDVTLTHSADKLEVAGGIFIIPDGALLAPSLAFSGSNGLGLSRSAGGRLILAGGNIQLGSSDTTFVSTQLSWDSDGGGNIGALASARPDNVYVKTGFGAGGVAGVAGPVTCTTVTSITVRGGIVTAIAGAGC